MLENLDRFITGLITVVPPALVVLAGWQLWNKELHLRDIVLLGASSTSRSASA